MNSSIPLGRMLYGCRWTFDGFVYLTSIMDLYSRKIIAWVLGETLEASHVVECIEKAKKIRRIAHPLIIHTDRGCQYVSDAFRKATEGMVNSYSKKSISMGQCVY